MSCRHRRNAGADVDEAVASPTTPAPVVEASKCAVMLGDTAVALPALVEAFIYTACALHLILNAPGVDVDAVAQVALTIAADKVGCTPWLMEDALTGAAQKMNEVAEALGRDEDVDEEGDEEWDDSRV